MRLRYFQNIIDYCRGKRPNNMDCSIISRSFADSLDAQYYHNEFYWCDIWNEYILNNNDNLHKKKEDLMFGLDNTSKEYIELIERLFQLTAFKDNILIQRDFALTVRDKQYIVDYKKHLSGNKNVVNPFIYSNKYGLVDLPNDIINKIDGNIIVDGGAYIGDTACLFNEMFPNSKIYSFEPLEKNNKHLKKIIKEKNLDKKVIIEKYGLSEKQETLTMYSNNLEFDGGATFVKNNDKSDTEENLLSVSIDKYFESKNEKIGLIKLDVEGFETKALKGAKNTIKNDKPIIVAALYHNPVDFYELKPYLQSLNPDYKFMIRRSELIIPMADIVLIAY